jgi:hypothetical protein
MPEILTRSGKGTALSGTDYDTAQKRPSIAQAANYTLTSAHNRDYHELADGITATLPDLTAIAPDTADWRITFKAVGATGATINPNGQNIDGSGSNITLAQNDSLTIVADDAFRQGAGTYGFKIVGSSTGTAPTLGTAAAQNIGTSGANVPLLNGANTWSKKQTFGAAFDGTGACTVTGSLAVDTITLDGNEISNTLIFGNRAAWYNVNFNNDPTNFPLGTVLAFVSTTTYQRGYQITSPQRHGSNNWWYHDSTYSSGGSALSGTWVSRGVVATSGSDKIIIGQRVA